MALAQLYGCLFCVSFTDLTYTGITFFSPVIHQFQSVITFGYLPKG